MEIENQKSTRKNFFCNKKGGSCFEKFLRLKHKHIGLLVDFTEIYICINNNFQIMVLNS